MKCPICNFEVGDKSGQVICPQCGSVLEISNGSIKVIIKNTNHK